MKLLHRTACIVLALTAWCAAACTDEQIEEVVHIQPASIKIGLESAEMKMSFAPGTSIQINDHTCQVYGGWVNLKEVPAVEQYFIYYPAALQRDGSVLSSRIPSSQKYTAGRADLSACPLFALVENDSLKNTRMKMLCGGLKISIPANDSIPTVTAAKLTSKADYLSGKYRWNTSNGEFAFDKDSVAKSVTVKGSIALKEGADVVFALPPLTLTDSLYLTLETANGEGTCRIDAKGQTLSSGKLLELKTEQIAWVKKTEYYGSANCIVVTPGQAQVTVDCAPYFTTSPYYYYENHPNDNGKTPRSARQLWNDVSKDFVQGVTMAEDGKTFTVALNGQPGNALIAIYDKEDPTDKSATILWSFHIWVTELNNQELGNGYTVLDRNVGAVSTQSGEASSIGMLYQWGRKDPFVSTGTYKVNGNAKMYNESGEVKFATVAGGSSTGIVAYSIKHPNQFIRYSQQSSSTSSQPYRYAYDWLCYADDALWGNPLGYKNPPQSTLRKSIYDPSPEGYMVAPMDTWQQAEGSGESVLAGASWQSGYTLTKDGDTWWYPIGGWRGRKDGNLTTADKAGYYWYSCPVTNKNANAPFMNISSGGINLKASNCRANACSVRCIKMMSH